MREFISLASILVFPFLVALIFVGRKSFKKLKSFFLKISYLGLILLSLIFIYSRYIERYLIVKSEYNVEVGVDAKVAVISDIHLGEFKDESFLDRVVSEVNDVRDLDALLIAGDFTYLKDVPEKEYFEQLFKPLSRVNAPVYAVFGNHDVGEPGPDFRADLVSVLGDYNVRMLNNDVVDLDLGDQKVSLVGLGDNWSQEDDVSLLENFLKEDTVIVLTHNPDTTLLYGENIADITIAGHSHGGQFRIPLIYKKVIPCRGDFDKGLHYTDKGLVFVSSGVGEIGLPLRFGVPPTIDILNFE